MTKKYVSSIFPCVSLPYLLQKIIWSLVSFSPAIKCEMMYFTLLFIYFFFRACHDIWNMLIRLLSMNIVITFSEDHVIFIHTTTIHENYHPISALTTLKHGTTSCWYGSMESCWHLKRSDWVIFHDKHDIHKHDIPFNQMRCYKFMQMSLLAYQCRRMKLVYKHNSLLETHIDIDIKFMFDR